MIYLSMVNLSNLPILIQNVLPNHQLMVQLSQEDVDKAVDAAWEAFKTWKNTTPIERIKILNQIADAIEKNKEHLAKVESMDNGKSI